MRPAVRSPSPIVSPSRASRESTFDSDTASLPSYRSAATATSQQSERYQNLMRYLDDAVDGRPSAGGALADESLSTISASPAPFSASGASRPRRQFVWDEEMDGGGASSRRSVADKSVTYFTMPGGGDSDQREDSGSAASNIESKVRDIKEKVQSMKSELRSKNELAKQLQNDYARAKAARERREDKLRGVSDQRVADVREGQREAVRQQQALLDRLQKDAKTLQEKEAKLVGKLDRLRDEWDATVEAARADVRRRRRREIQQWEADEAHNFSKLIASKTDAMHKSAAQTLSPELERVVAEGRDELSRREAEGDRARRALAESLREDAETKFAEFQKLCRERYSGTDVDRRNGLVADTRLRETRSRHEVERAAALDHFQREKSAADEEAQVSRSIAQDSHRVLLRSIQESHTEKLKEVISAQNREVAMLTEQLVADRDSLSKRLEKDRDTYMQAQRDRIARLETAARETLKLEMERASERGLAEVMERLQQEVYREREEARKQYEDELISLRDMFDTRVQDAESRESGAAERSARLRKEVDALRIEDMESRRQLEGEKRNRSRATDQLHVLKKKSEQRAHDCTEGVYSTQSRRHNGGYNDDIFRDLSPNSSFQTAATARGGQYAGLIAEKENEEMNWSRQALECGDKLKELQVNHAEMMSALEERNNEEISRIRDKIYLVTRRNQDTLSGLQGELTELQESNMSLQRAVDNLSTRKRAGSLPRPNKNFPSYFI